MKLNKKHLNVCIFNKTFPLHSNEETQNKLIRTKFKDQEAQCMCVYYICSPLSGNQPWQVKYQKKAHNPGKAEIMFLRLHKCFRTGASLYAKIGVTHYV